MHTISLQLYLERGGGGDGALTTTVLLFTYKDLIQHVCECACTQLGEMLVFSSPLHPGVCLRAHTLTLRLYLGGGGNGGLTTTVLLFHYRDLI